MLDLTRGSGAHGWRPPVVATVGTTGEGADALWEAVHAHRDHLVATGELGQRRQDRLREELALVVQQRIRAEAEARLGAAARQQIEQDLLAGRLDPWSAADRILGDR
jgi:LAO/AO transport system kinase